MDALKSNASIMENTDAVREKILAMEREALDRWGSGDPGGFLEINDPDVSYFDPFQEKRLDGLDRLTALLESIRGKIKIERSEIVNPRVQIAGDAAVLTFQFVSDGSEGQRCWNSTEVYRRTGEQWRIIHSHWSFAPHVSA
jgi:Calcium/calmodulin dependent protein kinase II association domain